MSDTSQGATEIAYDVRRLLGRSSDPIAQVSALCLVLAEIASRNSGGDRPSAEMFLHTAVVPTLFDYLDTAERLAKQRAARGAH